ncbi:MAG TPA: glycosyltransferase family 2 protein [Ferruginibacter sp.]|nr:glycosyltransferase family 2 protein [Ferruginibacter sp.]
MNKNLLSQLPSPPAGKTGWPWNEETDPGIYQHQKDWPKISIVTPSYNQGKFIEETIRSILLQNYPNIEYIIIDGESTDETIEIIKKYAPWINFWVSEKDNGQTEAINKGIAKSHGDLFNWVNSDDYLVNGALYTLASHLQKTDPAASMISGNIIVINEKGIQQKAATPKQKNIFYEYMAGTAVHQPATLFNTKTIKLLTPLDERLHYSMCLQMMLQSNLTGIAEYVNKDIIVTRLHPDSKSIVSQNKFYPDRIKTYAAFFGYFPKPYRNDKLTALLQTITKEDFSTTNTNFIPVRFSAENYITGQLFIAEKIARLYYFENNIEASKKIVSFIKNNDRVYYRKHHLFLFELKLSKLSSFCRRIKHLVYK